MEKKQTWREKLAEDAAAARLSHQRGKPAFGPRAMGAAVQRALAPILKAAGPAPMTLAQRWPEIVGPRLSALTEPVKVTRSKSGATLVVRAPSAAAPVIQHAQKEILEKVALATGAQVTALKIVQTEAPVEEAKAQPRPLSTAEKADIRKGAEGVETPALRDALAALGEAVAAWRKPSR